MKILITGSGGFIGYHLSKYLLEKKFDVVLSSVQVLYFTPKLDITKEVIKKLNDRVKKVPVKFESVEKK